MKILRRFGKTMYRTFYRLMMTGLVMLLIFLVIVQVLGQIDFQHYEEGFIQYLIDKDVKEFKNTDFEKQWVQEMQNMLGQAPPKISIDIARTKQYKTEQWQLFKQGIDDTVLLMLDVLGLGGKKVGKEESVDRAKVDLDLAQDDRKISKSWRGIAVDNLWDAAVALYRTVSVNVVLVDDKPVTIVKKTVIPFDRTDNILRWAPQIQAAAQKYDIDPAIIAGVMEQESGGNPKAISHAGAVGLMQLMPGTAKYLGVDPYDPQANIEGGARYLSMQLKEFGNLKQALAAYNAGPGNVYNSRYLYISETQNYLRRVPSLIDKYQKKFIGVRVTAQSQDKL
ncbi:lytic transglycosylase domain-containing protein [Metallumcola ferriviriculae]|uniref:Lytic transglycosylase domain-containing protein n=1 Tax=Metallumcola ferriviriculae TaxID=3039180 RepID=A0AAU0UPN0_9FIRM|nr:lytic transglycosylase domain-containing protein [Desulfitibacteraceae bacterium MK1]